VFAGSLPDNMNFRWVLLVLPVLACGSASTRAAPQGGGDLVDEAVYLVALESAAGSYLTPVLFVQRESEAPLSPTDQRAEERFTDVHRAALRGLHSETERSFWQRNRSSDTLPRTLARGRYQLIPSARWRERDARPVFLLSKPGYNRDMTQALVYVVAACPLCGGADYLLLQRDGTRWRIAGSSTDWNS
jgi:hypothetical protein